MFQAAAAFAIYPIFSGLLEMLGFQAIAMFSF